MNGKLPIARMPSRQPCPLDRNGAGKGVSGQAQLVQQHYGASNKLVRASKPKVKSGCLTCKYVSRMLAIVNLSSEAVTE